MTEDSDMWGRMEAVVMISSILLVDWWGAE
jgi:hypothetical protein